MIKKLIKWKIFLKDADWVNKYADEIIIEGSFVRLLREGETVFIGSQESVRYIQEYV